MLEKNNFSEKLSMLQSQVYYGIMFDVTDRLILYIFLSQPTSNLEHPCFLCTTKLCFI